MKVKLKDICTQIRGVSYKPTDIRDLSTGIPILRANNIQDDGINLDELVYVDSNRICKTQYIQKDDIVICASSGSKNLVGKAATFDKEIKVSFGAFCKVVRINPSNGIYKEFIQQYFQSKIYRNEISKLSIGANINNIKTEHIDALEINVPSIAEQKTIANQLITIRSAIDNKQKQLSELDELVKSRFIEMFGDPHNNTKYTYKNVGDFTTVTSGGTPDRKNIEYWKNGNIPWVKTTELQNNELTNVEEFITQKGLDESSAKMMPIGTLLIAMYGQGKTRGMTAYLGIEASTNQACACILPSKVINQKFLWYYFILSYDKLRDLAKGGNQPNLNGNMIKDFPVLMPPIEMQNEYVSFVQQIDKSKFVVKEQIKDLQELMDSKMQEYFGG